MPNASTVFGRHNKAQSASVKVSISRHDGLVMSGMYWMQNSPEVRGEGSGRGRRVMREGGRDRQRQTKRERERERERERGGGREKERERERGRAGERERERERESESESETDGRTDRQTDRASYLVASYLEKPVINIVE